MPGRRLAEHEVTGRAPIVLQVRLVGRRVLHTLSLIWGRAGLEFLLLSSISYAPGRVLFRHARQPAGSPAVVASGGSG
jgi:hypothetical protein